MELHNWCCLSRTVPSVYQSQTEKYYDFIARKKSKTEIILHSLESSLEFYKKLGYQDVQVNYFLMRYEGYCIENKQEMILLKIIIPKLGKDNKITV